MKEVIIKTASIAGNTIKRHEGLKNQDAFFVRQFGDFVCAVVADGASNHLNAYKGAKSLCSDVGYFLIGNADALWTEAEDVIKKHIAAVVRATLRRLVYDYGGETRDYGSTLMFVLIRKEEAEFLIGNLGDGVVACEFDTHVNGEVQRNFDVISISDCSIGRSTYLTTSSDMEKQLKICRCVRGDKDTSFRRVWIATDGCYQHCLVNNPNYYTDSIENCFDRVFKEFPEEDASYVSIEW